MKNSNWIAVAILLVGAACSGSQKKSDSMFGIAATTPEGAALQTWFDGDEQEAVALLPNTGSGAAALFSRGEIYYAEGDVERAYEAWADLLTEHPSHPLTRIAAARMYAARDQVSDFEGRIKPVLDRLDDAAMPPLTKVYVSLLEQTVAYRLWARSDSETPFEADRFGFAANWLKTPAFSPWRLRDFDVAFAPEEAASLAPRYLSPHTANDVEVNYEDVEPYWTSGITLYPGFNGSGVHYLETFATVEGNEPRDYWVYGNFVGAAKVIVDGQLVIDRREKNYEPGKRLRKVRLSPGTHRILVKLAYQAGYRDWFDLMFLPVNRPLDESGIDFAYGCLPERELPGCHEGGASPTAKTTIVSDLHRPADLEKIFVEPSDVARASDVALWVTMIAAHFNSEDAHFRAAWSELESRRAKFSAGHALWAEHVQTLWQVPSRLRDARALQALRAAYTMNPESPVHAGALGRWLTKQGEDREARELLERARDGARDGDRLRTVEPLVWWANYLDDKGWKADAEVAWREVLAADPAHCRAARELQKLLYARSQYDAPAKITRKHDICPELHQAWVAQQDTNHEARVVLARRNAGRYPLRGDLQRNYAKLLSQTGRERQAQEVFDRAMRVNPDSSALLSERIDALYGEGKASEALALLEKYRDKYGNSAWLTGRQTMLSGEIPLADLMVNGRERALEVVREGKDRALSNDEAYFAVDFAARRFFPDGSNVTLTHTVVRVMTKGAIDRYAEQSVPGNARILLVRTIKQDGTVLVPAETAGKSTLSMPGLAEGDFVEMAYLDYSGADEPSSHIEGIRFFFRMPDISTLHSEFVVIGDPAKFIRLNDAPAAETFKYHGEPAVRFLATDNPRPRSEPRTPTSEEYLPWVQMFRQGQTIGDVEAFRRDIAESIIDSTKTAEAFDAMYRVWTKADEGVKPGSERWLAEIFHRVAGYIPDPSGGALAFNTDVNHAMLTKDGNSMLVLKAVLDRLEVQNDVYLVKSKFQVPTVYPVREQAKYGDTLLRVVVPDTKAVVWLSPDGPDAMFNAVPESLIGQPAICATCPEPNPTKIPADNLRRDGQHIEVTGTLDAQGLLSATMTTEFQGPSAASIRASLRGRPDETSRAKFADALVSSEFAGASAKAYRIEDEKSPDEPLRIVVEFEVPNFARDIGNGVAQVETRVFREPIASAYAALPQRTLPLLIGSWKKFDRLTVDISGWKDVELASLSGERRFDSTFGQARRKTMLEGNRLVIESEVDMPIQRISVADYPAFQQWALAVEQSSALLLRMKR